MTPDTITVLEDCTHGSDESRLTFPQVIGKLMAAGIERYHADLQRHEKTYYLPDGQSAVIPNAVIETVPAITFSAAGVDAAVRAIQAGKTSYKTFCEAIMAAGCVSYIVSLTGRRAVYYGRSGEAHIELFPQAS